MRLFSSAVPNLLYNLVRRDLTVRYKSTVLGFFWSFLKPLALTGIFYLVFDRILGMQQYIPGVPFALFLLTGILAWTFFAGATSESLNLIPANANLIKKVKLPLIVFPLAVVISHLIHLLLALMLLFALLIIARLAPGPVALWIIPCLAIQCVFVFACTLILSALNVFYRDIASIWEVLLTAWLYATPIIYPANLAIQKMHDRGLDFLQWIYLANPLAPLMIAYRRALLYAPLGQKSPELAGGETRLAIAVLLAACVSVLFLGIGLMVFKKFSRQFADEL